MPKFKKITLILALTTISFSPAMADKGGKSKNHSKGNYARSYEEETDHNQNNRTIIVIDNDERRTIRHYVSRDYYKHCPPGLAKKHNGCMPPGQAKKYRIGHRLPDDVVFYPVPEEWDLHPPIGYQYVRVDKDVLLISEASKKIIDAVTLLSAVGE